MPELWGGNLSQCVMRYGFIYSKGLLAESTGIVITRRGVVECVMHHFGERTKLPSNLWIQPTRLRCQFWHRSWR